MDPELKKQIDEQTKKLPKASQEALKNVDWENKIREIGYRHGLLLDEIDQLYGETLLALIGLTRPENYRQNVVDHVGISEELSKKILTEVQFEIFNPILEEVKKGVEQDIEEHGQRFEDTNNIDKKPKAFDAPSQKTPEKEPRRNDVLSGIEHPEKTASHKKPEPSLGALKLDDVFTPKEDPQPKKKSALEVPKKETTSELPEMPKKESYTDKDEDPYLEPID